MPVLPSQRLGAGRGGEDGPAKTREAKVATFHTAEGRDKRTGLPRRDAGSGRVSAAIESAASCDADPEPSPFGGRVWRAAKLFGFASAKRRVAIGDGAKWIWNTVAEMLPGCVGIVDLWRAKEHLWEVGRAVCGHGTELCARWSRRVCEALEEGRVDDVLAVLRQHAETCGEAEKCVKHVEGNRRRMRCPAFRRMGLCIGSGAVESMCKGLVGERFKRRGDRLPSQPSSPKCRCDRCLAAPPLRADGRSGCRSVPAPRRSRRPGRACPPASSTSACSRMRWSVAGANAVLALRAAVFNDRYDDFWQPPGEAPPLAA